MPLFRIEKEKYIDRVKDFGNMISASVPFILCQAIQEKLVNRGDILMLIGTAAGLTCNMLILRY